MQHLNKQQGYKLLFQFLERLWSSNKDFFNDTLPGLLGDMRLIKDYRSIDPAMVEDWENAWSQQISNKTKESGNVWEIYDVARRFLTNYGNITDPLIHDKEIEFLLDNLDTEEYRELWELIFHSQ